MRRSLPVLAATASLIALVAPAAAQTTQSAPSQENAAEPASDPGDSPENTIVVVGSRVANRTVADSPVPIDVISSSALQSSGLGETNKVLNALVPSFNFPQPSIADGSDVTRPATLRGLNPDQTLVLLNGKRRHVSALLNINGTVGRGSAAVDMNMIPALAIERVEVLRDGASSQYGSDAIAGVINLQLKTASDGGRAQVSFGKYVTTLEGVADLDGLVTDASGQPVLDPNDTRYLQGSGSGERKARDGEYLTYGVNIGLPVGDGGFFNFTGEYRDRNFTNRQGFDLRPNYVRPSATTFDSREVGFNRLNFRYGDAKTEDFNFLINTMVPMGAAEFYGFFTYGHRDGLSAANFRQQSAATNRDFSTIAPGTTPTGANFVGLTPDGYLPKIQSNIDDLAGTAGLRTDLAGFKGDFSVGFGRNELNYRTEDSVNVSFGPQSQRSFDAGGLTFSQILANADLSRQFDLGLAGPLTFAFGGEYRHEKYAIRPGDPQSYQTGPFFQPSRATTAAGCTTLGGVYNATTGICSFPGRAAAAGAQGFGGLPASARTNVNRNSFAGYLEFDADLFTGLTATAAGRYEHFSDFGDTINGKLALRYEIVPQLSVRGSVSNGFRAPSLHQQFFTTTSTNFLAGVPVDVSTVPVSSPVARALGSQDLDPEKSLNLSGGITANPFRGFNLTVDYFHIKIRDRIVLSENLGAAGVGTAAQNAAVQAILVANGFNTVGAARFFLNGLDTTTQGVDAVATYRADLGSLGAWNLSAAYNYTQNKIDERLNNLGPLAQIPGLMLFGRTEGIRFERGQPRTKVVLSADGKIAGFGVAARTTRYGSVIAPETTAPLAPNQLSLTELGPDDQVLRPKWITDLSVSYEVQGVQLTLGADNVFDVYPTRRPFGPRAVGGVYPATFQFLPYTGFSPFGFNGRFLYGRVSVGF